MTGPRDQRPYTGWVRFLYWLDEWRGVIAIALLVFVIWRVVA